MASDDTTQSSESFVDVPGDPTMTRTANIPPVRVPLPLEAKMQISFLRFLLYVGLGLFGAVLVLVGLVMLIDRSAGLDINIAGALLAFFAPALIVDAFSYFTNLTRPQPHLTVDADGFWDRGATAGPLPWSAVVSAKSLDGKFGHAAVVLQFRRPVEARRRPTRLATLRYLWRRRHDEMVVPVDYFANRKVVARAMLALVRRHGGDAKHW